MIGRRRWMTGAALALGGWEAGVARARAAGPQEGLSAALARIEAEHGGRLGVAVLDTGTGRQAGRRSEERFPLTSTFKFLAAAFVLARVDRQEESLTRRIIYSRDYLVPYSPITEKHVGDGGLTVGEICEAAVTLSDNTAGNLLLDSFGGPAGLTAYTRSLGDSVTRLDRRETELNEAAPGDPSDTTTPAAMAEILRKTVLGTALSISSREQLTAWLVANKTGDKRLRAGAPKGWRVGDKTGSGENNTTNDIAVIWPPGRAPIIVAAYYTGARASGDERNAVLAEVGRLAMEV
ncbi:MAG TPA: class A beta-lactamase [Roseomonas sp.]|jgi:beta-lactamase class A